MRNEERLLTAAFPKEILWIFILKSGISILALLRTRAGYVVVINGISLLWEEHSIEKKSVRPEFVRECPEIVRKKSRKSPGKVREKSGISPGKVREKSGKSLKCTYKGLDIWYRNGEGLGVLLSAYRDYNSSYDPERGQETKEIKGIQVSYSIDTYLFLPPDEIPSDEEQKRADTDPHYFISYRSDCREIQQISNCIFSKDGIGYLLMSTDIPIPSNEMFGFAEIHLSQ